MSAIPDHRHVKAMDRPNKVRVPGLEATHCEWPQGAKVNHFMIRGIGLWQHPRETLVAGPEFVKVIARDGDEGPPRPEGCLTRTWARQDKDVKSVTATELSCLICHCPKIEDIEIIGTSDHVVVAEFQHDLWRRCMSMLFP